MATSRSQFKRDAEHIWEILVGRLRIQWKSLVLAFEKVLDVNLPVLLIEHPVLLICTEMGLQAVIANLQYYE